LFVDAGGISFFSNELHQLQELVFLCAGGAKKNACPYLSAAWQANVNEQW